MTGLEQQVAAAHSGRADHRDGFKAWSVVAILTAAYALAYVDRQILNLLVDPVKQSLGLTDIEISLLQGFSFMAAYVCFVPIMGRLVDTSNRRNILFIGCSLWCLFTALCGVADSFWELFFARVGVGASEACILPAGWSLIADFISPRRAPRAFSIFTLGPLAGGGLALIAGGAVVASADSLRALWPVLHGFETWQIAFIMIGLAGLAIAALLLTFREPPRTSREGSTQDDRVFSTGEALRFIWDRRQFYGRFMLGIGMIAIVLLGLPAWMPAFLTRYHGVDRAIVGFQFGSLVLIAGSIGVLAGPMLARWLEGRGHTDAIVRVAAASTIVMIASCAAIPFLPSPEAVLAATAIAVLSYSMPTSLIAAALQVGTPNRVRGTVAALTTFTTQVMGLGLAPTAIAFFTDRVFGDPAMVGWSLSLICTFASACAAWLLFTVLPHFRATLALDRQETG